MCHLMGSLTAKLFLITITQPLTISELPFPLNGTWDYTIRLITLSLIPLSGAYFYLFCSLLIKILFCQQVLKSARTFTSSWLRASQSWKPFLAVTRRMRTTDLWFDVDSVFWKIKVFFEDLILMDLSWGIVGVSNKIFFSNIGYSNTLILMSQKYQKRKFKYKISQGLLLYFIKKLFETNSVLN